MLRLCALVLALIGCKNAESDGQSAAPENPTDARSGPLPSLHQVPAFSLTDQNGRSFGSLDLKGKPYLAAFVFTRCPSICPKVMARMKEVDVAVKDAGKSLHLVSISVDPSYDTAEVLSAYAKKHGADVPNWSLLTGRFEDIAKTSEEGFRIGLSGAIDESKPHLGITHGSHFVLVDKKGTIRGYYRSSEPESVSELVSALDRL